MTLDQLHACPTCNGQGRERIRHPDEDTTRPCRTCHGTGHVPYNPQDTSIPY